MFIKNTIGVSFLIGLLPATLFKKGLRQSCFPLHFATASEYRNNIPKTFQTECEKNDLPPRFDDISLNETEL